MSNVHCDVTPIINLIIQIKTIICDAQLKHTHKRNKYMTFIGVYVLSGWQNMPPWNVSIFSNYDPSGLGDGLIIRIRYMQKILSCSFLTDVMTVI